MIQRKRISRNWDLLIISKDRPLSPQEILNMNQEERILKEIEDLKKEARRRMAIEWDQCRPRLKEDTLQYKVAVQRLKSLEQSSTDIRFSRRGLILFALICGCALAYLVQRYSG